MLHHRKIFIVSLVLCTSCVALAHAKKQRMVNLNNLRWVKESPVIQRAIIEGNPKKPGLFARVSHYKPGFYKAPHYHPHTVVTYIISGTFNMGFGPVFDKHAKHVVHIKPGTFTVIPAGVVHYEWADQPVVSMLYTTGPVKTIYVHKKS